MTDRWKLITSKKSSDPYKSNIKDINDKMIYLEEEKSPDKNDIDKIYERKKRNYSEMDSARGSKQQTTGIQLVPYSKGNILQIKNRDNISNFTEPTLKPRSLRVDSLKTPKNESTKIFAYESIEKFMFMDERFIDADRMIGYGGINPAYNKTQNKNYVIKQKIKYPDILFNIFHNENNENDQESFSFSGLFLPLNLLYFVRNSIIYLWDYNKDEMYTYKDISNIIVNLHITLPKIGVFSQEVTYIMFVATISELYLILIIQDAKSRDLKFIKSDFVYDVSDNIITSICSTSERRIFLGSQNNYLYELDYTNSYSFFGFTKKTKKITHSSQSIFEKLIPNLFNFKKHSFITKITVDNTRHLLFALVLFTKNEKNIFDMEAVYDSLVTVYDLGEDGMSFKKIGDITQNNIKEKYVSLSTSQGKKKDASFVITDIQPLTRKDSKYYNLVIITKNGIRVYIAFDTIYSDVKIKNEEQINEINKNKIYRLRPTMKYTMILKLIPEPSSGTIIEGIETDSTIKALMRNFVYNQIFYVDKKFLVFSKDEYKKRSYVDMVEYEDSKLVSDRSEHFIHINSCKETVINVLKFDIKKEIYSVQKLPQKLMNVDLSNVFKIIDYENFVPTDINFLDSNEHVSPSCMHLFATQMFLQPNEILAMTSSELIIISKLRPIDLLFMIISEIDSTNDQTEFNKFINEFNISETSFMLLTIMSNRNFTFYKNINESTSKNEDEINTSNILSNDLIEIKNNNKIIDIATKLYMRLIDLTLDVINSNILQQKEKVDRYRVKEIDSKMVEDNFIGQAISEQPQKINYISYSMFIYLARIGRLFWEEYIYSKKAEFNDTIYVETLQIHQIKYIVCLLNDFVTKIKESKENIFHKTSEIDIKLKNMNVITKDNLNYVGYNFSNISAEFEQILCLCEKYIETLKFVEVLYQMQSLKKNLSRLPKASLKEMTNMKFKDIIMDNKVFILKKWIEEYFEVAITENDYMTVAARLDELCEACPNIINKNDNELITANMLIKLSKSKQTDEVSRKNTIIKAVGLMSQNPENIRLDKMISILGDSGEVRAIVELCVKKAIHLKALLERDGDRDLSYLNFEGTSTITTGNLSNPIYSKGSKSFNALTLTQSDKENYFNEYKQCLYSILKLLNEVNLSIKNHGKEYTSNAPDYIKSILMKNLKLEEKYEMQSIIIEEILKHDMKFLHDLLFDHLKSEGMLDDILKYDSPYIEPYLAAQLEKEKSNPKRYEALYKFYLNSKNYEGALRILFQLINFDNNKIEFDMTNEKYVSLEDRRTYVKHLIYCLDLILESITDEEKKNFYIKLKNQVNDFRDSYLIQSDIYVNLKNILEKIRNKKNEETLQEALYNLDRNSYNLIELYNLFSNRFKLYEINFQIFFEMCKRNINIDTSEILENYESYFTYLIGRDEKLKWPHAIFPLLNKIFINLIESKTSYDSFYSLLAENNFENIYEKIIPLEYLIRKIETLNWNYIIKEKEIDFEQKSNASYNTPDNPFWFIEYLREVVKFPGFYLFSLYIQIYEKCQEPQENLVFSLNLLKIIKLWCNNVDVYISKTDKRELKIPRNISDDYSEFMRLQGYLQDILKNIYNSLNKNSFKIILEDKSRDKVIAYCKNVENKLHFIINTYTKSSKRKSYEPISLNIHLNEREVKDLSEDYRNKDTVRQTKNDPNYYFDGIDQKKKEFVLKTNILDQCD